MLFQCDWDLRKRLRESIVYYDVDTQVDFMDSVSGAVPVPGAGAIISNLEKLTNYARQDPLSMILGSVDRHFEDDAELDVNGGPFPPHCMDGSFGQKKINVTAPVCPAYIPNKRMSFGRLESMIRDKREIFFEKQHYDVFTNPNAEKIFDNVLYSVVYGVATDFCVKSAVLGMRELDITVFVVEDALAGLTKGGCRNAVDEMKSAGAEFIKTEDVLKGVVLNYIRAAWGVY